MLKQNLANECSFQHYSQETKVTQSKYSSTDWENCGITIKWNIIRPQKEIKVLITTIRMSLENMLSEKI